MHLLYCLDLGNQGKVGGLPDPLDQILDHPVEEVKILQEVSAASSAQVAAAQAVGTLAKEALAEEEPEDLEEVVKAELAAPVVLAAKVELEDLEEVVREALVVVERVEPEGTLAAVVRVVREQQKDLVVVARVELVGALAAKVEPGALTGVVKADLGAPKEEKMALMGLEKADKVKMALEV